MPLIESCAAAALAIAWRYVGASPRQGQVDGPVAPCASSEGGSIQSGRTHWLPVQASGSGQSAVGLHGTQAPAPSQTAPPWSSHAVPTAASVTMQPPGSTHAAVMQAVPKSGQPVQLPPPAPLDELVVVLPLVVLLLLVV